MPHIWQSSHSYHYTRLEWSFQSSSLTYGRAHTLTTTPSREGIFKAQASHFAELHHAGRVFSTYCFERVDAEVLTSKLSKWLIKQINSNYILKFIILVSPFKLTYFILNSKPCKGSIASYSASFYLMGVWSQGLSL